MDKKKKIGFKNSSIKTLIVAFLLLSSLLATIKLADSIPAPSESIQQAKFNSLENLISDFLDDAGNRLKKSKHINRPKQTMRFGRRSDPWLAPELPTPEALEYNSNNQPNWLAE